MDKAPSIIIAILLAFGIWYGVIILFKFLGLGTIAVFISHFSFIGWIMFGLIAFVAYKMLRKPKSPVV